MTATSGLIVLYSKVLTTLWLKSALRHASPMLLNSANDFGFQTVRESYSVAGLAALTIIR